MRLKIAKLIIGIMLAVAGFGSILISIFAYQLGIDHNPVMGSRRVVLLILGISFLVLLLVLVYSSSLRPLFYSPSLQGFRNFLHRIGTPIGWLITPVHQKATFPKRGRFSAWFAGAGAALAIFISFWYITSGRMTQWTPSSTYYNSLASGFLAGQLSLLEKPSPELLAITDPYHIENRVGVGDYLWDSSLYKGKFYLYWGPVPALMAAFARLFFPGWVVQDQHLVIFAISCLAIALAATLHRLRSQHYPTLPGWLVLAFVLLGVLNTPVFWLVNRPSVYEASIATGQLFIILGLLTALMAMEHSKRKALLLGLTGFFWGAAIGCRLTLVFEVVWMSALLWLFLVLSTKKWQAAVTSAIFLILPLSAWGGGLGLYNYARFGSVLETGHRYQLTGGGMPANYEDITSLSYALPNLYNFMARPIEIHLDEFPFVFTPFIQNDSWPKFLFYPRDPTYFYNEPTAGIFNSTPAFWILSFFLVGAALSTCHWIKERPDALKSDPDQRPAVWLGWMVAGGFLCNLAFLAFFISSTMRYEAEFTPLLTILTLICLGGAATFLRDRPRLLNLVLFLTITLIMVSILIGLLANFQNGEHIFRNSNPALYQAIKGLFPGD